MENSDLTKELKLQPKSYISSAVSSEFNMFNYYSVESTIIYRILPFIIKSNKK